MRAGDDRLETFELGKAITGRVGSRERRNLQRNLYVYEIYISA